MPIVIWSSYRVFNIYAVGQLLGILSLALIVLQPVLSSRFKPVETGVGHDRLLRWHSWNAKVSLLLVVLHPLFLFGMYIQRKLTIFEISEFYHFYGFWLGYVLLILLLVVAITSIFSRKLKIDYEVWKKIHLLTYIIILGGFIHSFLVGTHLTSGSPLYYWWLSLLVMSTLAIVHRKIYIPKTRVLYTVDRVVKETENVTSLYLRPLGNKLMHLPGQFAYTHFYSKSLPSEEHHFTISSAPSDPYLRFTIKNLGDFTSGVKEVKKNEKILVEGPYGAFTNDGMDGPFLFIAGGIGITPIMSMIKQMQLSNKQKTVLLYSVDYLKDLVFHNELKEIQREDWFSAQFLERRIVKRDLEKALTSLQGTPKVFLVGPVPMMDSIEKMLIELRVPSSNIYTERFALK